MFQNAIRALFPSRAAGYNLPDQNWFRYVRDSIKYSPDMAKLEEYQHQLFFACGETQKKHFHNRLLEGSEYKCPAFTQLSFTYWNPDSPIYPAVPMDSEPSKVFLPNFPPPAKIKGELHLIRPHAFYGLDNEYQNTVQFQRRRVRLIVPYRAVKWLKDKTFPDHDLEWYSEQGSMALTKERVVIIRAWMYIGRPEYWDKLISAFDFHSVATFQSKNRPWCPEYYQLKNPK